MKIKEITLVLVLKSKKSCKESLSSENTGVPFLFEKRIKHLKIYLI